MTPGRREAQHRAGTRRPDSWDPSTSPSDTPALTLNPMPPFLQHRQASMRAMTVKSPEKDTATTAREDDQESSLRGAPSAEGEGVTGQPPWTCPPTLTRSQQLHSGASQTPDSPAHPHLQRPEPQRPGPSRSPTTLATHGPSHQARACSPLNGHWAPLWPHPEAKGLSKQREPSQVPIPGGSWTPLHEVRVSELWEIALHVSSRLVTCLPSLVLRPGAVTLSKLGAG